MCVRQNVELASVTDTLIMCVAERRAAERAYRAEHQRQVNKKVDALRHVNQYGYTGRPATGTLQNLGMWKRERELRSVTDRTRLQNVDVWQRERDC